MKTMVVAGCRNAGWKWFNFDRNCRALAEADLACHSVNLPIFSTTSASTAAVRISHLYHGSGIAEQSGVNH
jgi:hypothetical protein